MKERDNINIYIFINEKVGNFRIMLIFFFK